ncbi:MAG TPA: type II secretion system F family protein [Candidatus Nanoarchaeia archaeon]|nr:type II secretion system F family protein [Candidatus Nanoarchaeia archaeon]
MKFHIPFTFTNIERLKKRSIILKGLQEYKKDSKLRYYLENSDINVTREQYINICANSFIRSVPIFFIIFTTLLVLFKAPSPFALSLLITLLGSGFITFSQLVYPKVYFSKKQKRLEINLMPSLEDMLVQLNSGVPLFDILVNISVSDYGEISSEFKKAVKQINAGRPQIEVFEELGDKNSSPYFRRTLWQISNGMKSGSDISEIIKGSLKLLSEEQIVQIQNYGNKLNPLVMFYMLMTIILPALAITFLTIISSMVGMGKEMTIMIYVGLFMFSIFIQVMFLGAIRSARPTLLT